ncbi:hypothetical protein C8J56DRAFT_1030912 [Mycena floridula]|nr:hypothetical protein C8J56DRAFT_1030912 [Mycena floridula]
MFLALKLLGRRACSQMMLNCLRTYSKDEVDGFSQTMEFGFMAIGLSSSLCNFRTMNSVWGLGSWLFTMCFPEMTLYLAMKEFLCAYKFAKKHRISMARSFIFCGDSFIVPGPAYPPYAVTQQVQDFNDDTVLMGYIGKKDIQKPKFPAIGLTMKISVLLFLATFIVKPALHIPFTIFEVASLTTFIMHIITWLILWEKPMNVELLPGAALGPIDA